MIPAVRRIPTQLMLLGFAAACVLHLGRAPLWCLVTVACCVLWHWLYFTGRLALPGRWARLLLAAMLLTAVLMSFGTVNGLAAGSALLMTMGGIKLLETRQQRDTVVVTTVALILVLAAGLERQNLALLPLYLGAGWGALATIAALGSFDAGNSARLAFRRAGSAMLLAVPFAILAFVLVPRLPGALWSLPGGDQAQNGLSEEMSPGSISDLAISDAIAFYVTFEGVAPAPSERYFRGPVLHDFDGSTWRNERMVALPRQQVQYLPPEVRYEVMLEPHNRHWLFVLDTAAQLQAASLRRPRPRRNADGQYLSSQPVTSSLIYQGTSHLNVRYTGELSLTGRARDTRLPEGRNPRSIELARTLRAGTGTDREYAERVMRHFAEGGFEYTLTPPLLNLDSVDDLLFNTRLGFCGHFASAFVTLMRAGGVPSRVVTGYLGGSLNRFRGEYVVRQSDAHAWAEVWLDGDGWVRYDPTGVVAPGRLQRGLGDLLPGAGSAMDNLVLRTGWLRNLRDAWDAAGSWWKSQVVNFNSASQRSLLSRFGLGDIDYRGMAVLLLAGAALWGLVLLALLRTRPPRAQRDALGRTWESYLALLQRRGLGIAPHEGPERIRRRAARALPAASALIERFTRDYERARFGPAADVAPQATVAGLRRQLLAIVRATAKG